MKFEEKKVQLIDIIHKNGEKTSFKKDSANVTLLLEIIPGWVNISYFSVERPTRGVLISSNDIDSISYVED